jgi:hypothetical protein
LSAGAVVGAALGFYLVSLRVASERAALEDVETKIALTQRDIRLLQTEIGTRGRLAQLERWNVKFIRLSAPSVDQFVDGGFQLATLVAPPKRPAIDAPVVLAAAPIQPAEGQPRLASDAIGRAAVPPPSRPASEIMHVASYAVPQAKAPATVGAPKPAKPAAPGGSGPAKVSTATKPVKTATADPLAPLPVPGARAKGSASAASAGGPPSKPQKARVTD